MKEKPEIRQLVDDGLDHFFKLFAAPGVANDVLGNFLTVVLGEMMLIAYRHLENDMTHGGRMVEEWFNGRGIDHSVYMKEVFSNEHGKANCANVDDIDLTGMDPNDVIHLGTAMGWQMAMFHACVVLGTSIINIGKAANHYNVIDIRADFWKVFVERADVLIQTDKNIMAATPEAGAHVSEELTRAPWRERNTEATAAEDIMKELIRKYGDGLSTTKN